MTKDLEALEKLTNYKCSCMSEKIECKHTIEKELKRLEELEKAFHALSKDDEKAKKLLSKEIEKNRALEIIKEKRVYPQKLLMYKNNRDFYNMEMSEERKLTKEEFEIVLNALLEK